MPGREHDGHRPGGRARSSGSASLGFYLFLTFAALILMLAANTSFAAFPRLAAVLAEDGFFPRQFAYRGDRLAFTAGIVVLGLAASVLIIMFGGDTHALIPLYAVGVFIDFTISQSGMVRHWLRTRAQGWRYRLAINADRRRRHRRRGRGRHRREGARSRSSSWCVIPILADRHVVHPTRVRHRRAGAAHCGPGRSSRRRGSAPGSSSRCPASRARSSSRSSSGAPSPRTSAPCISPRTPRRPTKLRKDWEHTLPGVPAGHHRDALPLAGHAVPPLPRRHGARPRRRHHHRRPARVRAAPLVGPAPLQPDGQPLKRALVGRHNTVVATSPTRSRAQGRAGRMSARADRPRGAAARTAVRPAPVVVFARARWNVASRRSNALSWASMVDPADERIVDLGCKLARADRDRARWRSTSSRSTGATTSNDDMATSASRPRGCSTLPRDRRAEKAHVSMRAQLLQARDIGAAIVDEAVSLDADAVIVGPALPQAFRG